LGGAGVALVALGCVEDVLLKPEGLGWDVFVTGLEVLFTGPVLGFVIKDLLKSLKARGLEAATSKATGTFMTTTPAR
jgi:hypothetical protein